MGKISLKSILQKSLPSDGIRICVMRHMHPEYDYDLWIPKLSPSEKLLKEYVIIKKMTWEEFSEKFKKQVIQKQKKLIKLLAEIAQDNRITLLCGEEEANYCHRSLLVEAINSYPLNK